MHAARKTEGIEIFSTAPQSAGMSGPEYAKTLTDVARWSEAYGCTGILIYSDNRLTDPWIAAQLIIQQTKTLCPLVAVQPVYTHPYTVAKLVSSLAFVHGRRTYLNMIAGGFRNDLLALDDETPHDRRYTRLEEYTRIVIDLLNGEPTSFSGEYYSVHHLQLTPGIDPPLRPGIFVSGSSAAGLATARELGATAIKYPRPAGDYELEEKQQGPNGIRIGIITREHEADAWQVAHDRFPEDRKGRMTHKLAMRVSDSRWHRQLTLLSREGQAGRSVYWLWPFENYRTFCPYLVGSYETVAAELAAYVGLGFQTFVLDIPASEQELSHIHQAFRLAKVRSGLSPALPGSAPLGLDAGPGLSSVDVAPRLGMPSKPSPRLR